MSLCRSFSYDELLTKIALGGNWRIVSSLNFEECSIRFLTDLLSRLSPEDMNRVQLVLFRLVSSRATPWSALEMIKADFEDRVRSLAKSRKLIFPGVVNQDYPVEQDDAYNLLFDNAWGGNYYIVVDYSALPKRMGVFITDMLFRLPLGTRVSQFKEAYAVIATPEVMSDRSSLGPFSVGLAQPIYHKKSVSQARDKGKLSVLIFPGWEGFEAKQTIDEFSSHNTDITVALGMDEWALENNLREFIANQAVLVDGVDNRLNLSFYFSPSDAFRIADGFVERSVSLVRHFPEMSHGLLVAPYGPKWTLLVAAYARQQFFAKVGELERPVDLIADVVSLSTSQYVSLHSRGSRSPSCFVIQ